MAERPILVLQMQRMGDLILSFPLFLWLERQYPGRPVWVAAEPSFFGPLARVSPRVRYVSWADAASLEGQEYELVINLSIREEAARLAGKVNSRTVLGPVVREGASRVQGDWQLYRTSIVKNNYYNRFHWADLNALDTVELTRIRETRFDEPRRLDPGANKVGLFLGASEPAKRPTASFWAELVRDLLGRGLRPVLFGGPAEQDLGEEVVRLAQAPVLNLCAKLGLDELSVTGQTLALFITPDTGPMHLAAWTGLRCLNLSMGNVNPWETGPYAPGHYVLRADMDCARGCWECVDGGLKCHEPFAPARVAGLAARLMAGDGPDKLARLNLPGLRLFRTGRTDQGLYELKRLGGEAPDVHDCLAEFWRGWFGHELGLWDATLPETAWSELTEAFPEDAERVGEALPGLGRQLRAGLAAKSPLPETFWSESPTPLKPFTGYVQMVLENGDHDKNSWARALELLASLTRFRA